MAPSSKHNTSAKDRRKSANTAASSAVIANRGTGSGKGTLTVTFTVPGAKLRAIIDPSSLIKEDSPVKDAQNSPANSTSLPMAAATNGENASDSTPGTPAADGTPGPQVMGPPTEGPKKKGVKRSAAHANGNGEPKMRGKPGPKKKQKLDDGGIEGGRANGAAAPHKLGPRANQGAINAGLRALDRSGKPCRKWNRGGFTLKTFTGVVWEIPRWTAPPKPTLGDGATDDSASVSVDGASSSNKENKDNENNSSQPVKSDNNSNLGGEVEMTQSTAVSVMAANSPAPAAIAVA